nr:tail spike protein [Klebsiella phage vB_Kpn_K54lambda2]
MALYREGKAAMAADGTVTGTGTKWQSSLSLIRPGATIMFLSSPIQMAVVNKVVSDTEIKAITTKGAVVASSDYAILLSDSLTVDGLAQDVAETLRYYQSQETVIAEAIDFFKDFNFEALQNLANQIKEDAESAESSAAAAAASENAAKNSEDNSKASEVAAETARDQVQQIINDAGEQSTLVVLAQDDGPKNIGYKNSRFDGVYPSSLLDIAYNKISLLEFIPVNLHEGIRNYTYTGDLSVYVQKAIDTANAMGGATIMCPAGQYYMNVKTKPNVILIGARTNTVRRAMPWAFTVAASPGSTRFRNYSGSDWIIKSATSNQEDVTSRSFGIIGIDFDAKDATNSTGGVRLRGPEFCVKSCSFYGFQDQGLEVSGNIGLIEDVIANECLKNRVRSDYVGTIEVSGASDCQIHRIEGNAQVKGLNSITNAEPYICGIKIAGNNHYISGLMGEISETGVYISASSVHHKVSDSRADNNVGPGYLLNGVQMVNCHSYNNSRSGDGLYPAFGAVAGSTRALLTNCLAWTDAAPVDGTGEQRRHSYGYDFSNIDYSSLRLKPWLNQCFSYGHSLGWINAPGNYGLQYTPTVGLLSVTSDATTTPNVDGVSVIAINTTSLIQITGLSGGMIGQQVDIYLNATATVTLVNSSAFLVNNFAKNSNKVMVAGRVYKFIKTAANVWREVGDTPRFYSGDTASRPSSAAVPGMQYFDTTLNKPIWRNAANNGWVDAIGTSV